MMNRTFGVPSWWLRRSVAFRVGVVVGCGTLVLLAALVMLTSNLLGPLLTNAADDSLRPQVRAAAARVRAGHPPPGTPPGLAVRVLDTAGRPADGGSAARLDEHELDALQAGLPVVRSGSPTVRWRGVVVSAPNGAQRLVAAAAPLTGYGYTAAVARDWMIGAAVLGAVAAGVLAWVAIRFALRPVRRMRAAARRLQPQQRLPVPAADDELRALAQALNGLLQRRDEATERLRRFTGDAAHELRSPVASIRAQAEVAVVHPDPDQAHEVLTEVVGEAERLSTLVGDLLVLARSDAGEQAPGQSVDLAFAVHGALERLAAERVPVRFEAPAGECSVLAAPAEVRVVLDNLLRNAVRYARAQVTVTVLPSGSAVRLLVDDDGPGVPVEHRALVFDRFYRVADDRGRESGGSGLGLALVAELVTARRGRVRALDSPEGGARFDVRWPAAR